MNGHGLLGRMLGDQMIVNGMLVVIAVSTLTFAYRHLRHVRSQRQSAHSRARRAPDTGQIPSPANPPGPAADGGRWTGGDPWMTPPPRAAAGPPKPAGQPAGAAASAAVHADDYPSWPGRIRAGPPPRRRCARTTTRAGPQARSHSGTRARSSWPAGLSRRPTRMR